jgi:ubiquinone/menaquinone biosynthesis C-methylase UbiE
MSSPQVWDANAAYYDKAIRVLESRFMAAGRRWIAPRTHGRTLVVGIGTGADLDHLPRELDLVGVDFSPGMLEQARRKAAGLGREIELLVADAMDLPFPDADDDAGFDSVVCTFALCNVPDERQVLGELVRVLKPGGELLLADHVGSHVWPVRQFQRGLEWFTGRRGEFWTRRPLDHLLEAQLAGLGSGLEVDVIDSRRRAVGVLEWVHARRR